VPSFDTTTSAGLLAYCKFMGRRPDLDHEVDDEEWYSLLTLGQEHWYQTFAVVFPHVLYGAPQKLVTADGGETYTFPSDVWPMGGVEIRASRSGELLTPTVEWGDGGDFVHEGARIRIPSGKTRTFADGPYARYIVPPGVIDASTQPTLTPAFARVLIGQKALADWAHRGAGQRDPTYFEALMQKTWEGNPRIAGNAGILAAIQMQYFGGVDVLPGAGMAGSYFQSPDIT
jgi:hypothetical protein